MRLYCEDILLFAADLVLLRDHFGSGAHVELVVDVPESVIDHHIDEVAIPHAIA